MNKFWKNKKVLITGHTGFKGSWLSLFLYVLGAEIYGLSKDKKDGVYKLAKIKSIFKEEYFYDLGNIELNKLEKILKDVNPNIIFHFAAQAIVSKGHSDPIETLNSNIIATLNLLISLDNTSVCNNIVIATTDKVYLNNHKYNKETDPLGGEDFYSFSKVGVERVIDIFTSRKENKLCVSVVRSGNVIGGGDRGEDRLMTDLITSFIEKKVFQVRNKKSIRPWQYVLDSIYGYLLVGENNLKIKQGEVFNLNSKLNNKYTVEYLIKEFEKQIQTKLKIKYSSKKFPEMSVLRLNSDKARKKLNWNTQTSLEETIEKVVGWENYYNSSKSSIEFSVLEIKSFISENNIDYEIQKN